MFSSGSGNTHLCQMIWGVWTVHNFRRKSVNSESSCSCRSTGSPVICLSYLKVAQHNLKRLDCLNFYHSLLMLYFTNRSTNTHMCYKLFHAGILNRPKKGRHWIKFKKCWGTTGNNIGKQEGSRVHKNEKVSWLKMLKTKIQAQLSEQ